MKLTYYQLEKQLTQKLLPAYIVSSDEPILKQESIDLIRQKAKEQGFIDRTRLKAETDFNWEELYNQLHSTSLFAIKQLVELDLKSTLPNKVGGEILKLYGDAPHPDTLLIIDLGKIDAKTANTAWCSALEKIGALITIWPIPHEQLPQWIIKRAKFYQLQMNLNAARMLAEYTEGNLIAASQTIEKLYLLNLNETIDEQLLMSLMTDESQYSIFEFAEHCIGGNIKKALHILEQLKASKFEPSLILWGLTREIRLLAELKQQMQTTPHQLESLMAKQRIPSKKQMSFRRFLTKYSIQDCWQFLLRAAEIDKIIKGIQGGNAWDTLQLFCFRFST